MESSETDDPGNHTMSQANGKNDPGLRATGPRRIILELLESSEECLTADEIHARLRTGSKRVGLATVYRTLNVMRDANVIVRVDAGDGVARYETAAGRPEDHHHHLICRSCHRVRKYAQFSEEELTLMKRTEQRLEQRFGYQILAHRIYFEGICPECRAAQ